MFYSVLYPIEVGIHPTETEWYQHFRIPMRQKDDIRLYNCFNSSNTKLALLSAATSKNSSISS